MSVEYNLYVPFQETMQNGIEIITKLRVLENQKESMLSVSDLGERERLTEELEGLWADVENECKSKFSFVISLTTLGRQKWTDFKRSVDHAIEVLRYSADRHCELWHDYVTRKGTNDSYEDYELLDVNEVVAEASVPENIGPSEFIEFKNNLNYYRNFFLQTREYDAQIVFHKLRTAEECNDDDLETKLDELFICIQQFYNEMSDCCDVMYGDWVAVDMVTLRVLNKMENQTNKIEAEIADMEECLTELWIINCAQPLH